MDIAILTIYFVGTWLIFDKFKLLPNTLLTKGIRYLLPAAAIFFEIILLGLYTPDSEEVMVQKYVLQIAPEYGGQVEKVYVNDQQEVKKGDLLFELDDTRFQDKVRSINADLRKQREYLKEYKTLSSVGAVSKQQYNDVIHSIEKLNAEKAIQLKLIKDTKIKAPFNGVIANLQLREGVYIKLKQPVMSLISNEKKWVYGFVDQAGMQYVHKGDSVFMINRMYPGEVFSGEVETIMYGSSSAQFSPSGLLPSSNQFQEEDHMMVKVALNNDVLEKLKFGTSGRFAIITDHSIDVLEIIRKIELRMHSDLYYFWILGA
ncbi:HlyD family secretion protein [Flammeovirga kamogawensis]|uniref:Efflux RND transporter periplasmic adaptor subunit n=1 Tax=Flammeovirga kamogawensis TaxID=373891 RepID=A0ABX8GVS2_9BACT|nr:efflux RND transporter periplasmic adaptor subunit [Flammeovirga kamogawensis]MBB6459620.1 multidrug resistance efflux pump [Flammeovirga kamogawensis]QWG07317.1 efflux RND transporter periplasmic adaptor subunit [Flammeovirga kamogawensis]TRX69134.1 HlyD family secretion protein [Flammeovirga kamogawensis]